MTLDMLSEGTICEVEFMDISGRARQRFLDLGIIKGTKIKVIQKSPLSDPIAYLIRGTMIALRKESAKKIIVKTENKDL